MHLLSHLLFILFGLSAGLITAASFVAFITMIGVIPKMAAKTQTAKNCILYENCLIIGILFFVGVQFFLAPNPSQWILYTRTPISLCVLFLCLIGLFAGLYTGLLIGGLSECLNVLPIYARKTHTQKTIRWTIYFLAFGKCAFNLFQYFKL